MSGNTKITEAIVYIAFLRGLQWAFWARNVRFTLFWNTVVRRNTQITDQAPHEVGLHCAVALPSYESVVCVLATMRRKARINNVKARCARTRGCMIGVQCSYDPWMAWSDPYLFLYLLRITIFMIGVWVFSKVPSAIK